METKVVSLNNLTMDNVRDLSEEDISYLLNKLISDLPKDRRPPYVEIISSTFDFRSIGASNQTLKGDLSISGYKFFQIPYNNKLVMGVRKKRIKNAN
jgi:hypothetical protein